MYIKTVTDIALENLIKKDEKSLRKTFSENYKTQQLTLEMFKKTIEHCDFNKLKDNRLIWNFASYLNIISYDLKIIGENLFLNSDEWGRRYFARQSALVIYESLDDILELSGREFRSLIKGFSNAIKLNEQLKILTDELNKYKKEHIPRLKLIRHNCAAHRDKNCIEQLKIITSINWSASIDHLVKFDKILMEYGKFIQTVINIALKESKELKE